MSGWKKNRELLESRLLTLMEIALSRPAKERNITFEEISQKAEVHLNKVEFLVMKALSRGLIRGSIDQIKCVVNISCIQPRVLSGTGLVFWILYLTREVAKILNMPSCKA